MYSPDREQLEAIFGSHRAAILDAYETRGQIALDNADITDTLQRLEYFLAQLAHEAGARNDLEEDLFYTTAARLRAVWPSRFRTQAEAAPFVRNPEALANHVYADRLGNNQPGDGWLYRGRGLIQLTGRENYRRYGDAAGLPLEADPDLAADPDYVWDIAAAFFRVNNLNRFADAGNFDGLTRAINGGMNGAAARRAALARVRSILASGAFKPDAARRDGTGPAERDGGVLAGDGGFGGYGADTVGERREVGVSWAPARRRETSRRFRRS